MGLIETIADAVGQTVDYHGFVFAPIADGRLAVVDEVEDGVARVGLYLDRVSGDAVAMHETRSADEAIAILHGWGV